MGVAVSIDAEYTPQGGYHSVAVLPVYADNSPLSNELNKSLLCRVDASWPGYVDTLGQYG